jgi:hypothetical protein
MKNLSPLARVDGIVVQEIKDEILVCDTKSNQVFCLNQTAGEVWKLCDGKTDAKEISRILSRKFRAEFTEEVVLFSIDELSKENLLAKKIPSETMYFGFTRREALKRVGLASMIALPLISSVTMPKAIHAQSGGCIPNNGAVGCPCNNSTDCASGCCLFDTLSCVANVSPGNCPNGTFCSMDSDCDSGCCNSGTCSQISDCLCAVSPAPAGCGCSLDSDCQSGLICCPATETCETISNCPV